MKKFACTQLKRILKAQATSRQLSLKPSVRTLGRETYRVLTGTDFLDHLLRETPAHTHINLRRSYFHRHPKEDDVFAVGRGVEAIKGVYQSIRLAEVSWI